MGKTFEQRCDHVACTAGEGQQAGQGRMGRYKPHFTFILHLVAEVEDGLPVFASEVFVGGLGWLCAQLG